MATKTNDDHFDNEGNIDDLEDDRDHELDELRNNSDDEDDD